MLLSENFAIAIRNFWQHPLKLLVPSITRLSVRPNAGGFAVTYYLEIGVRSKLTPAQRAPLDAVLVAGGLPGPAVLGAPGSLSFRIVTTGAVRLSGPYSFTGDVEPVRGGHKVAPTMGNGYGTLGCLVRLRRDGTLDTANVFFLSCWHVLSGPGVVPGYSLEWPRNPGSGGFSKALGSLYWSKVDDRFDVALGLVQNSQAKIGEGFAWSRIGTCPANPSAPINQSNTVVVCGHEDQATGTTQSTSATVYVDIPGEPQHMFTDQIQTDLICANGDSGAILFLDSNTAPIGMACCNNVPAENHDPQAQMCTFYNKLDSLFATPFSAPSNALGDPSFQIDSIIVGAGTPATTPKGGKVRKRPRHK